VDLLLDTNVLLRLAIGSDEFSESFKQDVESGLERGDIAVSTATFVEITRLHQHGRIDLGCHPAVWRRERRRAGLRELPIVGETAVESVLLMNTGFHNDPADQLIVATAMLAGMRLATTDRKIIGWARQTRLVPLVDPGLVAGSANAGEVGLR
jgi:PIN domain nuclease of toxin-antitoxin system